MQRGRGRKSIKMFVFSNKEVFLKTAKDVVRMHKDIVQLCIEEYNAPNVFEELKETTLDKTKFCMWFNNKKRIAKTVEKPTNSIVKTTKEVIKKKLKTDKIVKTQEGIVIERKPIEQTINKTSIYHKVIFQTKRAMDIEEALDMEFKRLRYESAQAFERQQEFTKTLNDPNSTVLDVDIIKKKSEAFANISKVNASYVDRLLKMQLVHKGNIENDKSLKEAGMYEAVDTKDTEDRHDALAKQLSDLIDAKDIQCVEKKG